MHLMGLNCEPQLGGGKQMDTASGPRDVVTAMPHEPSVLDDDIVRAAVEAANDQIDTFAELLSNDFAVAAAAQARDAELEAYWADDGV